MRFADALLDAPMFTTVTFDPAQLERRTLRPLRGVIEAYRAGLLRAAGDGRTPGLVYLAATDPLAGAAAQARIARAPAASGLARRARCACAASGASASSPARRSRGSTR